MTNDLLTRFHEEPLPPSGVDIQQAIRAGRRRGRTRIGLSALAVVAVLGAGSLVATRMPRLGPAGPTMEQLRVQGRIDLDRYESQLAAAGAQAGFVPVGELTGQIGVWEPGNGDNNKRAVMAGLVVADIPLPPKPSSTAKVTWDGGATLTVPLLSADDALAALRTDHPQGCPDCHPLKVTAAKLVTVRIATTQGEATVPAWEYSLSGTSVRLTRVAVSSSATFVFTPPSWDPYNSPPGTSIDSATVSGRTLTVHFIGAPPGPDDPCGASYEAETMQSEHAVVVLLLEIPVQPGAVCTAAGYPRTQALTLPSPLDGRAVLEVRQGMPVPVTVG